LLFHFTQTKASCQIPKDKSFQMPVDNVKYFKFSLPIAYYRHDNASQTGKKSCCFSMASESLVPVYGMKFFFLLYRLIICDFNFISSNNGTDNVSKISFFSFISHLAME
jgi:hypothetical protein